MKKSIPPGVAVAIIVVAVLLIGWFGYSRVSGPRLTREEQDKYLKPLQLGPGTQLPAPPQPAAQPGLPGPGPGGSNMPMPPRPGH